MYYATYKRTRFFSGIHVCIGYHTQSLEDRSGYKLNFHYKKTIVNLLFQKFFFSKYFQQWHGWYKNKLDKSYLEKFFVSFILEYLSSSLWLVSLFVTLSLMISSRLSNFHFYHLFQNIVFHDSQSFSPLSLFLYPQ